MIDRDPLDGLAPPQGNHVAPSDAVEPPQIDERIESTNSEFAGLLSELGSETPTENGTELDLKDVTIAALREMLEGLRPIGEQLADSEQRRTELEAKLEAAVCATHIERRTELELDVVQLKRSLVQAQTSLKKVRARSADRQRLATQRWREIQKLRSERTKLANELRKHGRPSKLADAG
jgi:chromosome segregation ATPase